MEHWRHGEQLYEVNSMYSLHDDAWTYELVGPRVTQTLPAAAIAVIIPDATPLDGPFTPMSAAAAFFVAAEGQLPWPVLRRFIDLVERSGDIRHDPTDAVVLGGIDATLSTWRFGERTYEVNSFPRDDPDRWCYEIYGTDPADPANSYFDVHIPHEEPFTPYISAEPDTVVVGVHGDLKLPWLVLTHFVRKVAGTGDIAHGGAAPPKSGQTVNHAAATFASVVTPVSDPPLAPPACGSGSWELVLVAPGRKPIELIRTIRGMTGFGLSDTERLLSICPSVVVTGLDVSRGAEFVSALEMCGAAAELRKTADHS